MAEKEESIKPIIFFGIVAVLWYFIRKSSGDYSVNKGIQEIIVITLLYVSGTTAMWISRYSMPSVTCNGFHGSILGRPIVLKDPKTQTEWLVFNTGEALQPVHMRGKLATLIIPKKGTYRAGQNYISPTFAIRQIHIKLPPIVHDYLYRNKADYNTENIYFGKFTEEFLIEHPEVPDYEKQLDDYHKQINLRTKIIEGDNDLLVEMKKSAEEIVGKEKWYQGFLPSNNPPPQQQV